MTRRKRTVVGLVLLFIIAFVIYSCLIVYGGRRKPPSRAKLVMDTKQFIWKDMKKPMKKDVSNYILPVDTCPRKPRLRHKMDYETLQIVIHNTETRHREKCGPDGNC